MLRVNRIPLGVSRLLHQLHPSLLQRAIRFRVIAASTRQHAVLPAGTTATRTRRDVIDGQLIRLRLATTILTHEPVTLEQVATAERNRRRWQAIELSQRDHFRDSKPLANRPDERLIVIRLQGCPVVPIVQLIVSWIDDLGGVGPHHHQRTSNRRHIDGLPASVQDQGRSLKHL